MYFKCKIRQYKTNDFLGGNHPMQSHAHILSISSAEQTHGIHSFPFPRLSVTHCSILTPSASKQLKTMSEISGRQKIASSYEQSKKEIQ